MLPGALGEPKQCLGPAEKKRRSKVHPWKPTPATGTEAATTGTIVHHGVRGGCAAAADLVATAPTHPTPLPPPLSIILLPFLLLFLILPVLLPPPTPPTPPPPPPPPTPPPPTR
eukprot:9255280-Pyramimonas_sp.AAC.3